MWFDVEIIFQVLTVAVFRSDAETIAAVVRAITVSPLDRSKIAVDAAVFNDQVGKMPFIAYIAAVQAKHRGIDVAVSAAAANVAVQVRNRKACEQPAVFQIVLEVVTALYCFVAQVAPLALDDFVFAAIHPYPDTGVVTAGAQVAHTPQQVVVLCPPGRGHVQHR